jgi:transcriptional regulator with XRE-family HTH domain
MPLRSVNMTDTTRSDIAGARIREVRKRRDWQPADLAARCAELDGGKWTENTIENIEGGRRRGGSHRRAITVDELLTLALALNVAPLHLIVPPGDDGEPYAVAPGTEVSREAARRWIRGFGLPADLPNVGELRKYMTEVPPSEFREVQDGLPQRLLAGRLRPYELAMFAKVRDDDGIRQAGGRWLAGPDEDGA